MGQALWDTYCLLLRCSLLRVDPVNPVTYSVKYAIRFNVTVRGAECSCFQNRWTVRFPLTGKVVKHLNLSFSVINSSYISYAVLTWILLTTIFPNSPILSPLVCGHRQKFMTGASLLYSPHKACWLERLCQPSPRKNTCRPLSEKPGEMGD